MHGFKVESTIKISKLKLMRMRRGMGQAELSERSGVPVKCIGNYEQQRRNLNKARVDIVLSLAAALSCSIEDILDT